MITAQEFSEGKILLIDKPLQWSSFQAVNKIKWAILKHYKLKKIKIGHAGTLDPLASGLLVICTGKYTKKITEIQDAPKTYTGTITLGASTPSFDMETEVDAHYPTDHITPALIEQVRQQFLGEQVQVPPVFSAIKKDGKRLYEFAREGEAIEVPSRQVFIYKFDIDTTDFPLLYFEVQCSKGTYIRSLANDFGRALQSAGYLSALRRTQIGDYTVAEALTPDDFVATHIPDLRKPIILTTIIEQFPLQKSVNDVYGEHRRQHTKPTKKAIDVRAILGRNEKKKSSAISREFRAFARMFTPTDKAISLTLLVLFITVITLLALQLNGQPKEIMIEVTTAPEEVIAPLLPDTPLPTDTDEAATAKSTLTTNAYNQADPQLKHSADIKTLDEIMAERTAQEMASLKETLVTGNTPTDLAVVPQPSQQPNTSLAIADKANKHTLVKYALAGRNGTIPNPVFTCEQDGQVVVIITVNEAGRVTKTAIDKQASTTTDDCLIENSLRYAVQAKFDAAPNKKEQIGTITYIFQKKR